MALVKSKSKSKRKPTKTRKILKSVGAELKKNEPAIVGETRRKKGKSAALAQERAILLSKAQKRGAKIKPNTKTRRR
jgi:hypothetical protein